MKLVVFGLTVSSSWGNGHATLWRALIRELARAGHRVVFFERDVPYYAAHRDVTELAGAELALYPDWETVLPRARAHLEDADAAMVTSYCPDGVAAARLVADSRVPVKTFYDLDTPVTIANARSGEKVPYLPPEGLGAFDLVLSFTGGRALDELGRAFGAKRTATLYGSVDPEVHRPAAPAAEFQGDLSYLGTFAADRQQKVEALFLEPARRLPKKRFVLGGAQYPADFTWVDNVWYVRHLPPKDHPAFYCSSALTLNVTRGAMAAMGWCPSGRLFEAAACGVPILSDWFEGLDAFFTPGEEILVAHTTDDAVAALESSPAALLRIAAAARERVLVEHSAARRAAELVQYIESVHAPHGRRDTDAGRAHGVPAGG